MAKIQNEEQNNAIKTVSGLIGHNAWISPNYLKSESKLENADGTAAKFSNGDEFRLSICDLVEFIFSSFDKKNLFHISIRECGNYRNVSR